jgi:hypothetical protein
MELFILTAALWFGWGAFLGYHLGRNRQSKVPLKSIKTYIEKELPNEFAAYSKGVEEGYEQGLHDGQDLFQ